MNLNIEVQTLKIYDYDGYNKENNKERSQHWIASVWHFFGSICYMVNDSGVRHFVINTLFYEASNKKFKDLTLI